MRWTWYITVHHCPTAIKNWFAAFTPFYWRQYANKNSTGFFWIFCGFCFFLRGGDLGVPDSYLCLKVYKKECLNNHDKALVHLRRTHLMHLMSYYRACCIKQNIYTGIIFNDLTISDLTIRWFTTRLHNIRNMRPYIVWSKYWSTVTFSYNNNSCFSLICVFFRFVWDGFGVACMQRHDLQANKTHLWLFKAKKSCFQ